MVGVAFEQEFGPMTVKINTPLRHLISLDGMSGDTISGLMDRAQEFVDGKYLYTPLRGVGVCTLFFEPSTRTRLSFQLAAQQLGAEVLNFEAANSSTTKGETAADTFRNIEAMGVRGFVIRHKDDGAALALSQIAGPNTAVINAGDGCSNHPTQGLLDMLTLRQAKGHDFARMKVVLVGDIAHSRVARSDLHALKALGVQDIRVCGPRTLLPADDPILDGTEVCHDFDKALDGVDAVMMLRLQRERMEEGLIESLMDYHALYGLTAKRLAYARPDAVVLHPGPINRGVEITDEVADGPQSLILRQVANGVAIRSAVMEALLTKPLAVH